jgi:hypothetical protein
LGSPRRNELRLVWMQPTDQSEESLHLATSGACRECDHPALWLCNSTRLQELEDAEADCHEHRCRTELEERNELEPASRR